MLEEMKNAWLAEWPTAVAVWSPFVQLREPRWCVTEGEEQAAGLSGSFAMIRLVDHSVVISLRQIHQLGLQAYAREILAHEVGHHVLCPADLTDNARLLARIRRGLPGVERYAPLVSNLYSDLLINDRLQRSAGLAMDAVYAALGSTSAARSWLLYMRIYELLWRLPPQSLAHGKLDARLQQDAQLGARLVRNFGRDWLNGGGRFACLLFPYLAEEHDEFLRQLRSWCDAIGAGTGGIPAGLADEDEDEAASVLHPALDAALSGFDTPESRLRQEESAEALGDTRANSGVKSPKQPRGPFEYSQILQASGVDLDERSMAARYYRELASRHLVPFPTRSAMPATELQPEGLDVWDISAPLEQIDWWATLVAGSQVIPGVTTRERLYGEAPGAAPQRQPVDLYLGVDCSRSMGDPARSLSYPILAGAVLVLSALRAGARVKVVLSGEPGQSVQTDGFLRDPATCLQLMTSYLGTGYAFGIHRLAETFDGDRQHDRPVHIVIISDSDMFMMLGESRGGVEGWEFARRAAANCGGGATYVLELTDEMLELTARGTDPLGRMHSDGWQVHRVNDHEQLVEFARRFSREHYSGSGR
jgi:hypothetical protein